MEVTSRIRNGLKEFMYGARGRTRTGMPCGEGFSSHFGFRRRPDRAGRSWAGARLHLGHSQAVGARRLLSTPSPVGAGLGSALARRQVSRAFTDFDGFHFGRFPPKAQIFKSLVSTNFTTRAGYP